MTNYVVLYGKKEGGSIHDKFFKKIEKHKDGTSEVILCYLEENGKMYESREQAKHAAKKLPDVEGFQPPKAMRTLESVVYTRYGELVERDY